MKVAAVVGFPLGANSTDVKCAEAFSVVTEGAEEIDMVMNIGWAKSGLWDSVQSDIERVVVNVRVAELLTSGVLGEDFDLMDLPDFAGLSELDDFMASNGLVYDFKVKVKVILETGLLSRDEIVSACLCVKRAGADFVKTSTGFLGGGATVETVALMRETVGAGFGVKASGGVRDYECAVAMVEAGADRIGTSSGVAICDGVVCENGTY